MWELCKVIDALGLQPQRRRRLKEHLRADTVDELSKSTISISEMITITTF